MDHPRLTTGYTAAVLAIGLGCLSWAVVNLPLQKIDLYFLILAGSTVGLGSWAIVKIPRIKTHIAVSDIFVFLALLLYGAECAIALAALEAFFTSWRFCSKRITVFFNVAAMALSTTTVVFVLALCGFYFAGKVNLDHASPSSLMIVLSTMAVTQFLVNTFLASLHDSIKNGLDWWETWKNRYIWTFFTYLAGAAGAGLLVELAHYTGFGLMVAAFPVILFVFLAYRMYLQNVEMSVAQAEQAERYAREIEERSTALRESEQRFRSAFTYAPIGIGLVEPSGRWRRVNHALSEILGYSENEFLHTDFQSVLHPDDLGVTLIKIHELLSGKVANCQMEQRYIHKDGKTVWTSWSVSADGDPQGDFPNLIFQIQDITDKKLAEEKLQHEATHDALTGLPNRSFFLTQLSATLLRRRTEPGVEVSVLFIDLDRFKYVNDSLGHLIGDELLIAIAGRLRECLRPADIVARLGGDEFILLVAGDHDTAEVGRIAERIQKKLTTPFALRTHEVFTSASIGILHASDKHFTAEDMMRDADTAMYQAKRAGRARHEVFDEEMHAAAKETLQLETDLRRAIEKREISILYQPVFSMETGEAEAFEALARWEHPTLGDVPPKKFIALAEEIGVIDQLGGFIMRTACTEMSPICSDSRFSMELGINLSCRQFAGPDLVERIKQLLGETGFPADRLRLEITETLFFEFRDRAIDMLHELRALGIAIDIDDFGTGYSNLSYLVQMPISSLKIDRSFIRPILQAGTNTEIIRTILSLARNLGVRVVAEGIETRAQYETLKALNCESAQGFYLSRPLTLDGVKDFLGTRAGDAKPTPRFNDVSLVSVLQ